MRVSTAVAEPAPYYLIDSEIVQVLANSTTVQSPFYSPRRSVDETLWPIERAVSGTTATTHTSGATLTAVYDPTLGGGAPVEVTLRSEEVEIAFDAANIATGATLFTIPDGDRVMFITSFVASALTQTDAILSIPVDGDAAALTVINLGFFANVKVGLFAAESIQAEGADVVLTVKRNSGTWTAGSMRFSFLVATPVA